ncbi:hypothetical protein GGE65_007407 [Skermanella aerolata]
MSVLPAHRIALDAIATLLRGSVDRASVKVISSAPSEFGLAGLPIPN